MVPYAIRVNLVHRMPRFRMTEQEAELMATYISAVLVDDTVPENLEIPASAPRAGARLYRELGCEGCHILDEKGGYVGPDLGNTGLRLRSGWVYSFLRYPQKYRPWSAHPDYGLNEKDALSLTGFLMSQRDAKTEGGAL
jgi:mono/diheme cytochrome c family protein